MVTVRCEELGDEMADAIERLCMLSCEVRTDAEIDLDVDLPWHTIFARMGRHEVQQLVEELITSANNWNYYFHHELRDVPPTG